MKRKYVKKDKLLIATPIIHADYSKIADYVVMIDGIEYKMWLDDMYDREHEIIESRIKFILKKTNMKGKVYRKRYNATQGSYKYELIFENDILL